AALIPLLPVVLPLVAVRGVGIWAGTRAGAAWAGVSGPGRDLPWMGLISQAGVAIGLAAIVAEAYGEMGAYLRTLLLGIVAINETVGPILFRRALVVSGEVRDVGEGREPAAATAGH
ncbi:MAG: hypothetical protein KY453_11415, partial [Gemmatimonadetes bacterium]|nr:hypothetical protein [Gemmatimonadota bacterium]